MVAFTVIVATFGMAVQLADTAISSAAAIVALRIDHEPVPVDSTTQPVAMMEAGASAAAKARVISAFPVSWEPVFSNVKVTLPGYAWLKTAGVVAEVKESVVAV